MNIGKLKGPEKILKMTGKHKLWDCKCGVLLQFENKPKPNLNMEILL
jgi:hypothetical protein